MAGSYHAATEKLGQLDIADLIERLYDGEMGRLIDCDPLYVSEEMCEVVDAARGSFDPEPLYDTDLLTPRGFLWWAKPLGMIDRYGLPLLVHAASWTREYAAKDDETAEQVMAMIATAERFAEFGERVRPAEMDAFIEQGLIWPNGIAVTLYADRDHYLYETQQRAKHHVPDWAVLATESVPVVPFHITPWHFGQTFEGNELDVIGEPTGAADWWRMLQTTFRLMTQRISVKHHERLARSGRRVARAEGMASEPEVVVIRLRREQGEHHEPTNGEGHYSHRWIVGGHWRNQPYRSEGIHRQIWISPYVKGPEDKPLIVRPRRVYQWDK